MGLFLFARPRYGWNYSPRSTSKLLKPAEHTTALPTSFFGWLKAFNAIPDEYVLQHQSLDAYFFLRFLK
jgi:calcium permeable stress-gated cation channel